MSNRPRGDQDPARRPMTKRQIAYQQREANVQRRILLGIGGAVLLALLIIAAGVIYDQMIVPGRTIKAVNGQTLSRGDYDRMARLTTIQQIAQSAQFAKLLGANASFGQEQGGSFTEQVIGGNQALAEIGTPRGRRQPVADETVDQWIDQQLVEQAAKTEFQIDPSEGEVDQLLVARLASLLPATESPTSTASITSTTTAVVTDTAEAGTDGAAVTAVPTTGPTGTPSPTVPPTPSPEVAEATTKANQIIDAIYDEYTAILRDLPPEASRSVREPHASRDDFATALRAQYRAELIEQRVKERLVAEVNPDETAEPEQISARHILLKVPKPEETPTPTATLEAEATAGVTTTAAVAATPTITPTLTPTLAPAVLEELFAERKQEADAIYQQVKADPEKFAEIATEKSEDESSAVRGGDLGSFGRGQMVPPFEEAAFKLKENEISEPVRSEFGWHIIQRLPEDPQAKLERQRQAAYDEWLASLRENATIVPAPTGTPTELPVPTSVQTEPAAEPGATEGAPAGTSSPASPATTPEATPEATTTAP